MSYQRYEYEVIKDDNPIWAVCRALFSLHTTIPGSIPVPTQ